MQNRVNDMHHTRRLYWLALGMLLLVAAPMWAAAPSSEALAVTAPEAAPAVPRAASVRKDANLVRVNGRPTVLTWAYGLTDPADLDAYADAGLNAVALSVTGASEADLAPAFELATAAEAKGLLVVGALVPTSLTSAAGEAAPIDARQPAYVNAVSAFVRAANASLGRHPRLIGWLVGAVLPEQVVNDDAGFRAFLVPGSYATLAALNRAWGTSFATLDAITLSSPLDVDGGHTDGVGRARLDLAAYRQKAYQDVMAVWARAIRREAAGKLVLAAGLSDYRSMISLGPEYDGLVPGTTPATAETDMITGNVQGVDIARRANQFIAIQTLDLSQGPTVGQLNTWMNLALLHGASGLAIGTWPMLRGLDDLRNAVRRTTDDLAATGWFPVTPRARAAVLYEPYAGGAQRFGRGLYGYLDGFTENEPTALFAAVRNGSRYGLIDVLSLESLRTADLHQYGSIFAPAAFFLPEDAQTRLNQYVMQGGALVADRGIGMYQAGGDIAQLPEIIRDTLGLRYAGVSETGPSQPGIANPNTGQSGTNVAPGPAGQQIDPQVAALAEWVQQMLQGPEADRFLGSEFVGPGGPGFQINGLGRGFAVYAPFFLYQQWNASGDAYASFHERVLGWAYDVRISQPDLLWPPVGVAVYAGQTIALAAPTGNAASVVTDIAPNQVYLVPSGAQHVLNPGDSDNIELLFPGQPLAAALPLPITVTPQVTGGVATVVVNQYDRTRIDLSVYGTGAVTSPAGGGVAVSGGESTPLEIVVKSGAFPVTNGVSYHVTVEQMGRRVVDQDILPNPDTGAIALEGEYGRARITIERAS